MDVFVNMAFLDGTRDEKSFGGFGSTGAEHGPPVRGCLPNIFSNVGEVGGGSDKAMEQEKLGFETAMPQGVQFENFKVLPVVQLEKSRIASSKMFGTAYANS